MHHPIVVDVAQRRTLVTGFLSIPHAVLALSQPASNLQDLIRAGSFLGPTKSSKKRTRRFRRERTKTVRTLPSDVLPESNAPAPPRASRRTRRRRNARVSTRTERGTQSDRGSDGTGQDPRTSVLDIQRRKSLIRDRKGLDLMPATLRIFFPNPSPPAFPNIVLSKTDKRLQHFGTRTNRKVHLDRSNRMTPDPRTDGGPQPPSE